MQDFLLLRSHQDTSDRNSAEGFRVHVKTRIRWFLSERKCPLPFPIRLFLYFYRISGLLKRQAPQNHPCGRIAVRRRVLRFAAAGQKIIGCSTIVKSGFSDSENPRKFTCWKNNSFTCFENTFKACETILMNLWKPFVYAALRTLRYFIPVLFQNWPKLFCNPFRRSRNHRNP